MTLPGTQNQAILELEARHDEVLRLLTDLEMRVAAVLAQHAAGAEHPGRRAGGRRGGAADPRAGGRLIYFFRSRCPDLLICAEPQAKERAEEHPDGARPGHPVEHGRTSRLIISDEPRNSALASIPSTSRLTDGSRPRWSRWMSNCRSASVRGCRRSPREDVEQMVQFREEPPQLADLPRRARTAARAVSAVRPDHLDQAEFRAQSLPVPSSVISGFSSMAIRAGRMMW